MTTLVEWIEAQALIKSCWPNHKVDEEMLPTLRLQHPIVARIPIDQLHAAIVRISTGGREWPPPVGLIYATVVQMAAPPALPFDEAWTLVLRAYSHAYGADERAGLTWLQDQEPLVARWVAEQGWSQLRREQADHPQHGGAVRHRLREDWQRMLSQIAEERVDGRELDPVAARLRSIGDGGRGPQLARGAIAALVEQTRPD